MCKWSGKTRLASLISGWLFAGMVAASAAQAADGLFLRLEGIQGESTDRDHVNEIVLLSYSQSFTNPVASGGARAGAATSQPNCGAITVTKLVDRSSPALIGGVLSGLQISTGVITFRKAGEQPLDYYKVTLTDVVIHSISQTDASATDPTTILEQISMSAVRFKFEYTPQKADGSPGRIVAFGWDCSSNNRF